jgi:hypothetical protein
MLSREDTSISQAKPIILHVLKSYYKPLTLGLKLIFRSAKYKLDNNNNNNPAYVMSFFRVQH